MHRAFLCVHACMYVHTQLQLLCFAVIVLLLCMQASAVVLLLLLKLVMQQSLASLTSKFPFWYALVTVSSDAMTTATSLLVVDVSYP